MGLFDKIKKNVELNSDTGESMEKLPKPVYYVESPNDDTVLLGLNVTVEHIKVKDNSVDIVHWHDTSHERYMEAAEIRRKDDYFAFKRSEEEGGGYYYFTPMSLDIYKEKVKDQLIAGRDFETEEDMFDAFYKVLEINV